MKSTYHTDGLNLGGKTLGQLLESRAAVIKVVRQKVPLDPATVRKIEHYQRVRNELIHQRATAHVTDEDIENYEQTVQEVLNQLFGLSF